MTGTVTAEKVGGAVTLTLRVSTADFIDLVAGLAWVDVLGGFSAWRTVLPMAGQPARMAGQFNLRRTYAARPSAGAADESGAPSPAAEAAPGTTVAAVDGADEAGSRERDCGCRKAAEPAPADAPGVEAPDVVPESAGEAVEAAAIADLRKEWSRYRCQCAKCVDGRERLGLND